MKKLYSKIPILLSFAVMAFSSFKSYSQRPDSHIGLSSAVVNFHFEYYTCPVAVLPLNIHQFNVTKLNANKDELIWTEEFKDSYSRYHYEAERSRDGHKFKNIGTITKNTTNTDPYRLRYMAKNEENGVYFFRRKQAYSNGYTRFSDIKSAELESSGSPKFNFYPNPSNGIVGIKFADNFDGKLFIRILNIQAQT